MVLMWSRFGIELAPEVVQADGNVQNLAWRICNAKKVLVSICFNCDRVTALILYRLRTACHEATAGIPLR